jgi:uncharacterized protein
MGIKPAAGLLKLALFARQERLFRRLDGALASTGVLLAAIALFAPEQLPSTVWFVGDSAIGILPFLLVSILTAAWLRAAGADQLIGRAFAANPGKAIVLASLLGALSPFCSCGVIPVIAALLVTGVPLAPVMAFWVASPIMAPDMYFITAGALGFEFATAKAMAAVGIGLVAGYATQLLQRLPSFAAPLRARSCSTCGKPVIAAGAVHWRFWQERARSDEFIREALRSGLFLGKWLLLAFVLESLMLAWLPTGLLAGWVGDNALAIPLAAFIGVPAYLNGYAAVPIVAGMIQNGMAPGAGLAFMVAGSMTSIPAAIAVFTLVKYRVFAWYVLLALVLSMASGYGYGLWLGL